MAWIINAWLTYDSVASEPRYFSNAEALGNWIQNNCYYSTGIPGYIVGFTGWPNNLTEIEGKSTDDNFLVFVAFKQLYRASGNNIWDARANIAGNFTESMWDATTGHFWAGQEEDGDIDDTPKLSPQTYATLTSVDTSAISPIITWVEDNLYVDTLGYEGFSYFSLSNGIWWSGTAQTVCCYQVESDTAAEAYYLDQLRQWQVNAENGNGKGLVACIPDSIWTGYTNIFGKLHIGTTSWFIFGERNCNPLWVGGIPQGFVRYQSQNSPGQFHLSQNYPNPFNPSTTLSFSLPKSGYVRLVIYDILGRELTTLVEDWRDKGEYKINFDGSNLSSGIYIARLEKDSNHSSRKLVLLK